jgi:hypothetical protein
VQVFLSLIAGVIAGACAVIVFSNLRSLPASLPSGQTVQKAAGPTTERDRTDEEAKAIRKIVDHKFWSKKPTPAAHGQEIRH